MTKQAYEQGIAWIKEHGLTKPVIGLIRGISALTGFAYICVCFSDLWKQQYRELALTILVPAVSFLLLTLLRKKINAPRPYELFEFKPLLKKDTKGKSFPSRHVFSGFVIAGTIWWQYPAVSVVLFAMGAVLAVLRVLSGVHFPKDVLAGAICGILCAGLPGLFL